MNLLAAATLGQWLDTTFAGFDMAVFEFFGRIHNDILTLIAKIFTSMGSTEFGIFIILIGIAMIFFRKTRKYGFALVISIALGLLMTNLLIKPMALRIRPYNSLQEFANYMTWYTNAGMFAESDYCFPSGHTTAAVEIAVSMMLCRISDKKYKMVWIFPLYALLVGCSRVYLMVHYASDILGGIVIGIIAGILGYLISKLIVFLMERSSAGQRFDLERRYRRKHHRGISKAFVGLAISSVLIIAFLFAYIRTEITNDHIRCAYDGEYKCYNEAQTGSKYPAIDGEYYCKIHWKELTQQNSQGNAQEADAENSQVNTQEAVTENTQETTPENTPGNEL